MTSMSLISMANPVTPALLNVMLQPVGSLDLHRMRTFCNPGTDEHDPYYFRLIKIERYIDREIDA